MGLPFTSIPDVLAPDDVPSFQHEQLLVDKVNDAASLIEVQHERTFTSLRGAHTSAQFPVAMGMYQFTGAIDDTDPWTEILSWNIMSRSWRKWSANLDGTVRDYYDFIVRCDWRRVTTVAADVFVEFAGAPGTTPRSNLTAIAPYVSPRVEGDDPGSAQHRIHFGNRDIDQIKQFLVVIHGTYVTR